MLSPDQRTVAMDMLRPPAGCRIDQAVLTTYTLDLDLLLALPLAVLAHSDRGVEEPPGRHGHWTWEVLPGPFPALDWLVAVWFYHDLYSGTLRN